MQSKKILLRSTAICLPNFTSYMEPLVWVVYRFLVLVFSFIVDGTATPNRSLASVLPTEEKKVILDNTAYLATKWTNILRCIYICLDYTDAYIFLVLWFENSFINFSLSFSLSLSPKMDWDHVTVVKALAVHKPLSYYCVYEIYCLHSGQRSLKHCWFYHLWIAKIWCPMNKTINCENKLEHSIWNLLQISLLLTTI